MRIKNILRRDTQMIIKYLRIFLGRNEIVVTFVKKFNMRKFTEDELKKIDLVEKVLCKEFNVSENDFASKNSTANVSLARGFLFHFLHKYYNLSVGKMSKYYFRSPRSIFWNVSKMDFLIKQRAYRDIYERVCVELEK